MSFHSELKDKILSKELVKSKIAELHLNSKKVVFTNGCFDILHPGHVTYLAQARDLGDFLILGLNTDASVKKLNKGFNRPINTEHSRATILASLSSVDSIVFFNEETPYELIKFLVPDILIKGDDYAIENISGHDIVLSNGGKVITVPLLKGYSTTGMIEKIKSI